MVPAAEEYSDFSCPSSSSALSLSLAPSSLVPVVFAPFVLLLKLNISPIFLGCLPSVCHPRDFRSDL